MSSASATVLPKKIRIEVINHHVENRIFTTLVVKPPASSISPYDTETITAELKKIVLDPSIKQSAPTIAVTLEMSEGENEQLDAITNNAQRTKYFNVLYNLLNALDVYVEIDTTPMKVKKLETITDDTNVVNCFKKIGTLFSKNNPLFISDKVTEPDYKTTITQINTAINDIIKNTTSLAAYTSGKKDQYQTVLQTYVDLINVFIDFLTNQLVSKPKKESSHNLVVVTSEFHNNYLIPLKDKLKSIANALLPQS